MASDQFPSRNVSAALPRRSFLFLATPAAVAGGAAGLCSGAFAATPCAPAEAPEFSALVATYERADAAFLAADRARADALAMYHQLRPPVPDALVLTYEDELLGLDGDLERDVEGNQVYGPNGRDRRIIMTEQLRFHAQNYGPRTKAGRAGRKKLPIAEAYERGVREARDSSAIEEAMQARYFAVVDLEQAAHALMMCPAPTLAGIAAKGRAFKAFAAAGSTERIRASFLWGPALAEAVADLPVLVSDARWREGS